MAQTFTVSNKRCANCDQKTICKPLDYKVTDTYSRCYKYPELPFWIPQNPTTETYHVDEKGPIYECKRCGHLQTLEEMSIYLVFANNTLIAYLYCEECGYNCFIQIP